MDKKDIRKDIIIRRDAIRSDEWITNSNIIQRNIIKSLVYERAENILCYADFHGEVGTLQIIEDALIKGKNVFLPKVLENFDEAKMDFYKINSTSELIEGYKGILEPTGNYDRRFILDNHKTLMLVPGVAFTEEGYRLGYGKGYYDRYLYDKTDILKVGICFFMQIINNLPVDKNDIKMDYIISEKTSLSDINKIM